MKEGYAFRKKNKTFGTLERKNYGLGFKNIVFPKYSLIMLRYFFPTKKNHTINYRNSERTDNFQVLVKWGLLVALRIVLSCAKRWNTTRDSSEGFDAMRLWELAKRSCVWCWSCHDVGEDGREDGRKVGWGDKLGSRNHENGLEPLVSHHFQFQWGGWSWAKHAPGPGAAEGEGEPGKLGQLTTGLSPILRGASMEPDTSKPPFWGQ